MACRRTLFALALALLAGAPSFGLRDLWNPDEPRYAQVSWEMLATGEYVVPHLNGEIYAEKPPLFFWASAALQVAGVGESAGRVLAAAAAAGSLLLAGALAALWFSRRAALWSVVVLGTCELFARFGRIGVLDGPLTFWTTLAVYGWFRHRTRGGPAIVVFYVGIAFGILTKGPVALVSPVLAALAGRDTTRSERANLRHLAWGIPLALGIVAAWAVPACLSGGADYARAILWDQHAGRIGGDWGHPRPPWYYLPYLVLTFLPWTLFLPRAFAWAWRGRKEAPALRTLVVWFVLGFVFFSFVRGKRERYLLPLFPALAILTGAYIDAMLALPEPTRSFRRVTILGNALFVGVGACLALFALLLPALAERVADLEGFAVPVTRALLAGSGVGLAALGGAGVAIARRGHGARAVGAVAAAMAAALLSWDLVLVPRVNDLKSPRQIAEVLARQHPDDFATYPHNFSGAYNLYTRRVRIETLETPGEVREFLASAQRRIVLTDRESLDSLGGVGHVLGGKRVGHHVVVLLANYDATP